MIYKVREIYRIHLRSGDSSGHISIILLVYPVCMCVQIFIIAYLLAVNANACCFIGKWNLMTLALKMGRSRFGATNQKVPLEHPACAQVLEIIRSADAQQAFCQSMAPHDQTKPTNFS